MQSRQKFLAQADLLRRTAPRKKAVFLPRFAIGFVAALLVVAVLGTGAVAASGSALPGDPLYGLKRTVENVRLNSASSPTQRQELRQEFDQRRRDEANELLDARRESAVEFTGTIEVIQPNAWIVSGLVVQVDANTQIAGTPQINRVAEVHGMTGPNGLRASSISIEPSDEPTITPTPRATETPAITPTIESTAIVTPTTVVPTMAATPRPTIAPRPTATPQPTASPEPVKVEFTGNVNAIGAGTWNIDGTLIGVNANTEIRGSITPGQRVKVTALRYADGRLIATRIELDENTGGGNNSGGNDNQNGNGNQNGNDGGNSNSNDNHGNANGNDHSGSNDNGNDHGGSNANGNDHSGSNDNGNDSHGGGGGGN